MHGARPFGQWLHPRKVKISKKMKSFEWCLFFLEVKGGVGGSKRAVHCVRMWHEELFDDEKPPGTL